MPRAPADKLLFCFGVRLITGNPRQVFCVFFPSPSVYIEWEERMFSSVAMWGSRGDAEVGIALGPRNLGVGHGPPGSPRGLVTSTVGRGRPRTIAADLEQS